MTGGCLDITGVHGLPVGDSDLGFDAIPAAVVLSK